MADLRPSRRQARAARKRIDVAAAIQPRSRNVSGYLTIGNAMAKLSSMRRVVPALALLALAGSTPQLRAQEQCPELTRLRSQVAETAKRSLGAPSPERCEAYVRISMDWAQLRNTRSIIMIPTAL